MLKAGANPNVRSREGESAIYLAAVKGQLKTVQLLPDFGADPNTQNHYTNRRPLDMVYDQQKIHGNCKDMIDLLKNNNAITNPNSMSLSDFI